MTFGAVGAGSGTRRLARSALSQLFAAVAVQVGLGLISEDEDGLYTGPLYRLVSTDTSDKARDIHELWFNVILALIILHVGAIIFYRLRGRKLTKAMFTGRASIDPGAQPMRRGKWWVALICLAIGIGVTRWVIAGAPPFSP